MIRNVGDEMMRMVVDNDEYDDDDHHDDIDDEPDKDDLDDG